MQSGLQLDQHSLQSVHLLLVNAKELQLVSHLRGQLLYERAKSVLCVHSVRLLCLGGGVDAGLLRVLSLCFVNF